MEKKRYANIDLLKTIAIIMVIALHSQLFITDFIKDNNLINDIEYKKIKNKIENEYAKYNKLNNSNYGFA